MTDLYVRMSGEDSSSGDDGDLVPAKSASWARLAKVGRVMGALKVSVKRKHAVRASAALAKSKTSCDMFFEGRVGSQVLPGVGVLVAYKGVANRHSGSIANGSLAVSTSHIGINAESEPTDSFILHETTGVLLPGTLTVVCDSDGSASMALLHRLAGRNPSNVDDIDQVAFVCGTAIVHNDLDAHTSFVSSDTPLPSCVTVEEAIWFSARLRCHIYDSTELHEKVMHIMKTFRIDHVRNCVIGGDGFTSGISPCERRRVSIAIDAVSDPNLFILQDPLEHLDAFNSMLVLRLLRQLADSGRTVVMSMSSPSTRVLDLVDDVILISTGRVVYKGPPDKMGDYFQCIGVTLGQHSNILDAIIDAITRPTDPKMAKDHVGLLRRLDVTYKRSSLGRSNAAAAARVLRGESIVDSDQDRALSEIFNLGGQAKVVGFGEQFRLVLHRYLLNLVRRAKAFWHIGVHMLVFSILVVAVWSGSPPSITLKDTLVVKYYFFVLTSTSMVVGTTMSSTIAERSLLRAELADRKMYSPKAYFFAQLIATNLPFALFVMVIFALTFFFVSNSDTISSLAFSWATVTLSCVIQSSFVRLVAFATGIAATTTGVTNVFLTFNALFMGHLVPFDEIPRLLQWGFYCSHMQYALSALTLNEFGSRDADVQTFHPLPSIYRTRWYPFVGLCLYALALQGVALLSYHALFSRRLRRLQPA